MIIYEDNHLLVVNKPVNMLVQKDNTNDLDLLTYLKNYIKEKYHKPSNVYLGLVHRLDRTVGGVMVFAKTSKAASRLSEQIRNHTFKKYYRAVVLGKVNNQDTLIDKLSKNEKTNTTYVSDKGKISILDYKLISYKDNFSLVDIDLKTGRSHQIRVQFSSRNHPLYGDKKYNKNYKEKEQIALFAYKIVFNHPITKDELTFEVDLPNKYPWTLF